MRTLVVGIGNPILGSDSIGIRVANRIKKMLGKANGVEVTEFVGGGIKLAETILGYDRVILIDCVNNLGNGEDVMVVDNYNEIKGGDTGIFDAHDMDFITALEILKRACPEKTPKEIKIIAINCKSSPTFSENLPPHLYETLNKAINVVMEMIKND